MKQQRTPRTRGKGGIKLQQCGGGRRVIRKPGAATYSGRRAA